MTERGPEKKVSDPPGLTPSRQRPAHPGVRPGGSDATSRIGILAGGGRLPIAIAESVLARGGSAHIVAIEGEADAEIARLPHTWVNWGQVGLMVATLRRHADAMVIAGSVRRPNLWKVRPDWGFIVSLPKILEMMVGGDDSVLSRVVRFFEAKGMTVLGAHEIAPELLAPAGPAGALALDAQARADAELGFAVRSALGALDAGQAVVTDNGEVLAIEGAEGTDAMLARVAAMLSETNAPEVLSGVLAKGPKPGQELRVDMPAVGPRTIERAAEAGLAGVAVEAGGVLLLDRSEAIAAADTYGIAIEGLAKAPPPPSPAAARRVAPAAPGPRILGRLKPDAGAEADVSKGLATIACLEPFLIGQAVVVARAYILAIAAQETVFHVLTRTRALRQWGVGAKRRIGVLAFRPDPSGAAERGLKTWTRRGIEELFEEAAAAGLAGVVVTGRPRAVVDFENAAVLADNHGLFLALQEEQP